MEQSTRYELARQRATAKFGFYRHALIYAPVMILLLGINMSAFPGTLWVIWPLLGWGLALGLHGARVFLMPDGSAIIDAMTEQELQRADADARAPRV